MPINDDELAKDWEKISAKYAVKEGERPADEPPPDDKSPEEPKEEPKEGRSSEERARDGSGKFVKAEKDGQSEPTERKAPPDKKARGVDSGREGAPDAASQTSGRDTTRAPSSWRPGVRDGFAKLPEGVRAEIHRREQDFERGQAQLLPDAQLGRSMRETIEPYRMLIEAEGGTPERAVASLLRTAAIFRVGTPQQKWDAYAQVGAQFLGVDLKALLGANGGPAQPGPNGQAFQDPRVDQLLARQQQIETESQRREQSTMEATVSRFMDARDTRGEAKYPYLNDVINEMAALIPQIREANPSLTAEQALEEGYQRAIWAHPEIRPLLQQKAASERDAKRRTENQDRVREARRAASVNVPRRASLPSVGKPGTIEETIAATARELGLIS